MAKINLTPYKRVDSMELTDAQSIRRIESYLYTLNEQLRYELSHIDEDNMSSNDQASVGGVSNAAIRNVVQEEMENQVIDISQNETIIQINRRIDNLQKIQRSDEDAINQIRTALNQKASQATVDLLSSSLSALSGTVSTVSSSLTTLSSAYSTHKHSLSVSDGTISIGGPTQSASSFNIADTQFYKDAVRSAKSEGVQSVKIKAEDIMLDPTGTLTYYSAAKKYSVPVYAEATNGESNTNGIMIDASEAWNAGWDNARACVAPPSAGTGTSFTVSVPAATRGDTQTYTFTIQKGATPGTSGYASVALGQSVVGRISIGDWYSAGYNAGFTAGQSAGESIGYTRGWNEANAQYSAANYARKNLNRYGHAELYVKERETYYSAGNHYWYWSSSDGWDTLYTKS